MTVTEENAIRTLVSQLKSNNIWSGLTIFYPFVGTTANQQKLNLINPADTDAAYRLTFSGPWIHSGTTVDGSSAGLEATGGANIANTNWDFSQTPGSDARLWFGVHPITGPLGLIDGGPSIKKITPWVGTTSGASAFPSINITSWLDLSNTPKFSSLYNSVGFEYQGDGTNNCVLQNESYFSSKTGSVNVPHQGSGGFVGSPCTTVSSFISSGRSWLSSTNKVVLGYNGRYGTYYAGGKYNCFFLSDKNIGTVNLTTMRTICQQFKTNLGR